MTGQTILLAIAVFATSIACGWTIYRLGERGPANPVVDELASRLAATNEALGGTAAQAAQCAHRIEDAVARSV